MMSVGRINPLEQVYGGNSKTRPAAKPTKGDSVSISPEAVEKAEQLRITELVSSAPDTRAERIAELKEKINSPSYINEAVLRETAESIVASLFPNADSTVVL
ncbi:MAG: flagellar biosynthesis anti-sigma factor FlgM [Spirochaetaceae bacterium]|jgi:negative regulator of flagellin synthesis FlgM|nr:flagellar biosynthesis anti-sigma factor FlgM [Spirochaetaceae bacterium]